MKRFYDGEDGKGLLAWLAHALKTGRYKIKTKYVDASLKGSAADVDREMPVSYIIDQSFRMLKDLGWEGIQGIYLFFDEINLSFASKATHKRDVILIRDLLIAIDRLNSFFIEEGKPIYIMAAARSEVLHALNAPTHEINKILADRGRELRWSANTAGSTWPIFELVRKKIEASEATYGIPKSNDIISKYFHREIFGFLPQDFVPEVTWCNPRDLVLLFGEAAEHALPNEPYFGETVIARVLEKYSSAAWREKAEELSVEYAPQEIQAIKKSLLNANRHFRLLTFQTSWKSKADSDATMKMMLTKYDLTKIAEDLFRIGIIGQSSKQPDQKSKSFNQHWAYRGDSTFDPTAWLIVHKALWPELRLGKIHA